MSRTISNESAEFLLDELLSIRNMINLALLALENGEDVLIPTALETAYQQLQRLVEEFCMERK